MKEKLNSSKIYGWMPLTVICIVWLKTITVQLISFNLSIQTPLQYLITSLGILGFLLFTLGFSYVWKSRIKQIIYVVLIVLLLDLILIGNVVFYRFYSDFVTISLLAQTSNFGDLGSSITDLIHWTDLLIFVDIVIVGILYAQIKQKQHTSFTSKKMLTPVMFTAMMILFVNLVLAHIERPQLLTRSFDRVMLVKNLGIYNYHLYDVYTQAKVSSQRAFADSDELTEIKNYVQSNELAPNEALFGKYADRNVIFISMESVQSFVLNNEMNGEIITPFLHTLTKDADTLYFSDFYHQTGLGKSSDAEFLLENGLFGAGNSSVFFTHSDNTYTSLSEKLGEEGYYSSVLHANNDSFWNRNHMYNALAIDDFYDIDAYRIAEGEYVNWGMKDIPFFAQSATIMSEFRQPFYARLITLTNHFPFYLDEEDKMIAEFDSNSGTLNRYFQTVRYTDEAIKIFFEDLKEKGLYENSIIVIQGDHYGISSNHDKAMAKYLQKEEISPVDTMHLQSVPFFIHIPNSNAGKEITKTSGQIDVRPTLLHLLGIDTSKDIQLGRDILSDEFHDFVVMRDGSVMTKEVVYTEEGCYNRTSAEELEMDTCQPFIEKGNRMLRYSDQIILSDLLRFDKKEHKVSNN